ncbi:hypothetical protein [Nigerium massiliense]|uniref:hypothetical protein n=1 Tax=Nigerium massiliense TaxID=1522317 RepID=UPI00058E4F59|nr:hypothetical protein [Nigerium massiliense]
MTEQSSNTDPANDARPQATGMHGEPAEPMDDRAGRERPAEESEQDGMPAPAIAGEQDTRVTRPTQDPTGPVSER